MEISWLPIYLSIYLSISAYSYLSTNFSLLISIYQFQPTHIYLPISAYSYLSTNFSLLISIYLSIYVYVFTIFRLIKKKSIITEHSENILVMLYEIRMLYSASAVYMCAKVHVCVQYSAKIGTLLILKRKGNCLNQLAYLMRTNWMLGSIACQPLLGYLTTSLPWGNTPHLK